MSTEPPPGYKTQSADTDYATEQVLIARWRSMSPLEKAELLNETNRFAHQLSMAGVRARHPDATERELELRCIALRLGRDLMIRVYGWDPDVMGW